jgi:antitoxin component YwqK of YwqJK toxin-antitoxin module
VRDLETYQYDSKGFLIEKKTCSGEPSMCNTSYYTYNDLGNLTQELQMKDNKSIISKDVYNYDAKGKMTEHSAFDNNYLVKDTYDSKGDKIETLITYKGAFNGKSVFTYDDNGNMVNEIAYNELNQAFDRMEYVYY